MGSGEDQPTLQVWPVSEEYRDTTHLTANPAKSQPGNQLCKRIIQYSPCEKLSCDY